MRVGIKQFSDQLEQYREDLIKYKDKYDTIISTRFFIINSDLFCKVLFIFWLFFIILLII